MIAFPHLQPRITKLTDRISGPEALIGLGFVRFLLMEIRLAGADNSEIVVFFGVRYNNQALARR